LLCFGILGFWRLFLWRLFHRSGREDVVGKVVFAGNWPLLDRPRRGSRGAVAVAVAVGVWLAAALAVLVPGLMFLVPGLVVLLVSRELQQQQQQDMKPGLVSRLWLELVSQACRQQRTPAAAAALISCGGRNTSRRVVFHSTPCRWSVCLALQLASTSNLNAKPLKVSSSTNLILPSCEWVLQPPDPSTPRPVIPPPHSSLPTVNGYCNPLDPSTPRPLHTPPPHSSPPCAASHDQQQSLPLLLPGARDWGARIHPHGCTLRHHMTKQKPWCP
jgi:hypothetical protein